MGWQTQHYLIFLKIDEVDFLTTHRLEINPIGERDVQLKRRMAAATFEQMARYSETHDA